MTTNQNSDASAKWVGGFVESNPAFGYPDLTSLPILRNMDNIPRIERQQKVIWPEFSWETIPGNHNSRCFQMFAPDISRVGYDNTGRIWSIICPQQGHFIKHVGCMNIEVTVTGQRGWVDETNQEIAADLGVEGTIWFSPSSHQNWFVKKAWNLFEKKSLPFPSNKANAIKVTTHKPRSPEQPIFAGRKGISTRFNIPEFAKHPDASAVGNLSVEIGPIKKTNHPTVDQFNEAILDLFNIASGNILLSGNVLTWNLWFTAPERVCTEEWTKHAEKWRKSIDADHGSPGGSASQAKFANGSLFKPAKHLIKELEDLHAIINSLR